MDFGIVFSKEGSTISKSVYKDNRGLTLVELIIGITILAIIVVPLLQTFIVGAGTEVKSHQYGQASDIAQSLSEQIQATTMDAILLNATVLTPNVSSPSAKFYKLSDGTSSTNAPALESNKYYIRIPGYPDNSSSYNALVTFTLDTADSDNTTPVVVGNKMDAMFNMSSADNNAELALKSECGYLMTNGGSDLTIASLTRSITLNVTKSGSASPYTFTTSASFIYTGTITGTAVGNVGTSYPFTHTEQSTSSASVSIDAASTSPVLSAFVFLSGYYKAEAIQINNLTGSDVNFFLVYNDGIVPSGYSAAASYNNQNFISNGNPTNKLVFTNVTGKVTYSAYNGTGWSATPTVSTYLVEQKQLNRKFNINIQIFKSSSNYSDTPIVSIDSTKLNY